MRILGRDIRSVLKALRNPAHYKAGIRTLFLYQSPIQVGLRYLFNRGSYPADIIVNTPSGRQRVHLFTNHDLLTVHEVFAREIYRADSQARTIVDFGSNIGISILYFATHCPSAIIYGFEPVPLNVERLKQNLASFSARFELQAVAISTSVGRVEFLTEDSGRYGKLQLEDPAVLPRIQSSVTVNCVTANSVIQDVLSKHGSIDVLKLDIEGLELLILQNIPRSALERIHLIYAEIEGDIPPGLLRDTHDMSYAGMVARFRRR